uniref:Poly(A) RNA polymerase mitochondrial-like central palm domain-containing protein n=1 Tax=Culex tarsalis TaxID=7177 RepID=A0A1Q3F0N2_CULTA
MVQASKQELYLLNWEIANLTQKLQSFSEMYSSVDLKTLEFLEKMIKTTDRFLTQKSLVPVGEWDAGDKAIFAGYTFSRSINCKMCDRSVKITKPGLLKHLAEHDIKVEPAPKVKTPPKEPAAKEPAKKKQPVAANKPRLHNEKPCLEEGCLPKIQEPVSNKMKKFLTNKSPQDQLKATSERKQGQDNAPVHMAIAADLEKILAYKFPNVKVHPFGSRVTGLGNDTSDVDIYLDLDGNQEGNLSKDTIQRYSNLVQALLQASGRWSEFNPILKARTPILRTWNIQYKLDCDLSFSNGLSMCNTELIQYFFEIQPVCSAVTLYVKEWARFLNIEALNGYTVTLLTIFFFQAHKLLPSVHELQTNNSEEHKVRRISHWRVDFERKTLEQLKIVPIPESQIELYLSGFFAFYGEAFKFETQMVCPFMGKAQLKIYFDPLGNRIPAQMKALREYYATLDMKEAHPVNELLQYAKPMVVQDPFELNHNVAKGLMPINVSKFRKLCAETGPLLQSAAAKSQPEA